MQRLITAVEQVKETNRTPKATVNPLVSVIASYGSDRFLKLLTGHNTDGFDLNGDGFTIENWLDPLVSCGSWVLM